MKRIATVFGLFSVAVALIVISGLRNEFFDSKVYHGAVQYWFRDGGMVYDWLRPGTPYGFTYPPFAGLVMAPMAWLPLPLVVALATIGTMVTVALLVHWMAGPYLRSKGWTGWFPLAGAFCFALAFEPVRETITFGQVNTLLLAVVAFDMLFGVGRDRKWAGIGIGLATAIKLTPGVFILYLVVTRRWRALFTAIGAATAVTLLAGAIFPDQSRVFWTSALWDTNRVGVLSFLSNQSLRGMLARGPFDTVESTVWLVVALATLGFWAWRVARTPEDVAGGLALTGVLGCLLSPVTWVHHCVWLMPALILCLKLYDTDRRRFWLGASAYVLMTSHATWLWETGPRPPLAVVGSNIYVLFSLALLVWTPLGTSRSSDVHERDKILA
ncbi:glycosyltransferase 87 family protein [Actinoplanes couchii]|uniref:Membrane protein n=1 Tax=Actinoplanes couchii TaxID=403638 RepID=A0ABQ3X3F7_9ACTN|nr:glycosyltransferase 87 family protein [Actinoplanes couchii]MDR6322807.1 alpha-1,2-mannosyltransferase [Actinoplanes couchii]GID53047.1 membrane protein [Actinoplanes couchii]